MSAITASSGTLMSPTAVSTVIASTAAIAASRLASVSRTMVGTMVVPGNAVTAMAVLVPTVSLRIEAITAFLKPTICSALSWRAMT